MTKHQLQAIVTTLLLALAFARPAAAQCGPEWHEGGGVLGAGDLVYCSTMWDPDGAGPESAKLVIGGRFLVAGNAYARRVAAMDPATGDWEALGTGVSRLTGSTTVTVNAVLAMPNGDLVVGGSFTAAGGEPASNVARWDGERWSALGAGLSVSVRSLAMDVNGDVLAGTGVGLARWDGASWTSISEVSGEVRAIAVRSDGRIFIGGRVGSVAGQPANCVAYWNGSNWLPMGAGVAWSSGVPVVHAIAVLPNGNVVVGGEFMTAGGAPRSHVAQWDGTTWAPVGTGFNFYVHALSVLPSGDLIAAGYFDRAGQVTVNGVARWNGVAWSALGDGLSGTGWDHVYTVTRLPNGDLVAGGEFNIAGNTLVNHLARFDGVSWGPATSGTNGYVQQVVSLNDGDLAVCGTFTIFQGVTANYVACKRGGVWESLGGGVNDDVHALTPLANGDLIAGGDFTVAGGQAANRIARWDGNTWSPLGTGMNGYVSELLTMPNRNIVAAGTFTTAGGVPARHVAMWNGESWSGLGIGAASTGTIRAMCMLPNGELVIGGSFTVATGAATNYLARWNGETWVPFADEVNGSVYALSVTEKGEVVAAGAFTTAGGTIVNRVAVWDGASWSPFGPGLVNTVVALALLPNGRMIASTDGSTDRIWHWDGFAWQRIGIASNYADTIAVISSHEFVIGGPFQSVDSVGSSFLARCTLHDDAPRIYAEPSDISTCIGESASISVSSSGTGPLAYQWRKDGVVIDPKANASAATSLLVLEGVGPEDVGSYDCVVSNHCGNVESESAALGIDACCPADFDGDGFVTGLDFDLFVGAFEAGAEEADFDGDGFVTGIDFDGFVGAFELGCE